MFKKLRTAAVLVIAAALIFAEMSLIAALSKTDGSALPIQNSGADVQSPADSYINSLEIKSNRFTHVFEPGGGISRLTAQGYEKILENGRLSVMLNPDNYDIRVTDHETGYIWGGIESSLADDLNTRWKNLASSLAVVTCLDSQLAEKTYYSAEASVKKSCAVSGDSAVISLDFGEAGISFDIKLTLKDDGFSVSVDDATLVEYGSMPITGITLLPFFGSARLDEINGYFFIPDGSGALMRFSTAQDYISSYSKRIYGTDLGSQSDAALNNITDVETRPREFMIAQPNIMFPVFGVVHGVRENAFWVEIENGAEYCSILADAAGSRVGYHYIRAAYTYRECFIQPTAKNGTGVRVFQSERNQVFPMQTYHLLTGDSADYVGMAVAYRDILISRGELSDIKDQGASLRLDVIAAVRKGGYLGNSTALATSPEYITEISDGLKSEGITGIIFDVEGWLRGGVGGYDLKRTSYEKSFASSDRLKELDEEIGNGGNTLLLNIDGVRMTDDQFTVRTDIATKISQQQVKVTIDNDGILFPDTFYRRNDLMISETSEVLKSIAESGLTASLAGAGELVYSDWLKNEETARSEALKMQRSLADEHSGVIGACRSPNSYYWKYSENAFDMPDHSSQYRYFSDTVPFLQIVLHGSVNCFSESLNEGTFSRTEVLRLIEYGQYPSFTVTEADNYSLTDSALYDVYSTQYEDWKEKIVSTCIEVNSALSAVKSAHISGHEVISDGFVRVSYDNGCEIYVNYTDSEKECGGVTVAGLSWRLAD